MNSCTNCGPFDSKMKACPICGCGVQGWQATSSAAITLKDINWHGRPGSAAYYQQQVDEQLKATAPTDASQGNPIDTDFNSQKRPFSAASPTDTTDWEKKYAQITFELDLSRQSHMRRIEDLLKERDALQAELFEECRINGMGAQRELKLITERNALKTEIDKTYQQCVGRDFMHLNLADAVQAVRERDWERLDAYREALDKLVTAYHNSLAVGNSVLVRAIGETEAMLRPTNQYDKRSTTTVVKDEK